MTRKSGAAPTAAEEPEPSATAQKDIVVHPHATEASALVQAPDKSIIEAPQPVDRQLALLEVSSRHFKCNSAALRRVSY